MSGRPHALYTIYMYAALQKPHDSLGLAHAAPPTQQRSQVELDGWFSGGGREKIRLAKRLHFRVQLGSRGGGGGGGSEDGELL
jgi:hypothetical protein